MPVCEIHRCDMKLIPAGVSKKTGKPYNAFYACQVNDCTFRPPAPQTSAPAQSPHVEAPRSLKTNSSDGAIIRQVAFKGVIELISHNIITIPTTSPALEKEVHTWTDKFDRIIQSSALHNPLQERDELPVIQQNEDMSVEDIPF